LRQIGIKVPGGALFQFITFRVLLAVLFSLVITMIFGKKLINYLLKKQVGETVRDLGLVGEQQKKGTPTMGGFIIILGILIPTLLLANLDKAYIRLMIFATLWLGMIGFIDDFRKLAKKRNLGLTAREKFSAQIVVALLAGPRRSRGEGQDFRLPAGRRGAVLLRATGDRQP